VPSPAGLTRAEIVAFAVGIVVGPNFTDPESRPASPLR
jgi:hypothetical protein